MAKRAHAQHGIGNDFQPEECRCLENNNSSSAENEKVHTSNAGILSLNLTRMIPKTLNCQWTVRNKNLRRGLVIVTSVLAGLFFFQYICRIAFANLFQGKKTDVSYLFEGTCASRDKSHSLKSWQCTYDAIYPASKLEYEDGLKYRIALVSDLDEDLSKVPGKANTWRSYYKEGYLIHRKHNGFDVEWDENLVQLTSTISEKGRGLELSELAYFNRKLLSVDDRTGIVYQIKRGKVLPWVLLTDGDGTVAKGFKGEWMTVKDRTLYVGGLGKEWTTTTGEVLNFNPQFVKSIGPQGEVQHHDWRPVYLNVQKVLGIASPGYVIHEAVCWSPVKRRWYFLPRRASHEKYDDKIDERKGTNYLISCDEYFQDFKVTKIGKLIPTRGFSSFKFIPGFHDEVAVAIKSEEVEGKINSYIMVFNIDGTILMEEKRIGGEKFEGVEFV